MAMKMEKAAFPGLLLLLTVFYLLLFHVKSGYYVDELWTYGLSNSYYQPFLYESDCYLGEWHDPEFFLDYLATNDASRFSFDSVRYNQAADVHPPLYYSLLHLLSSLFPGVFSKWFALLLNLLFFLGTEVILYRFGKELFPGTRFFPYVPMILYGFGAAGISTTLYIRMYAALTFFGVSLLYVAYTGLIKKESREKSRKFRTALLLLMIIALGQLTQTTFVIYAFFVLGSSCVYLLFRKDYKQILLSVLSACSGLLLAVLCFPAMLHQIFGGVGADVDAAALRSQGLPACLKHLGLYYEAVFRNLFADGCPARILYPVTILFLVIAIWVTALCLHKKTLNSSAILLDITVLLSAFCYFIIVAMLNSGIAERYMYMIYPLFILYPVQLLYRIFLLCSTGKKSCPEYIVFLGILLITVFAGCLQASRLKDEIVVDGYAEAKARLQSELSDVKAVFIESTPHLVIEDTELLSLHGETFTTRADALTDPEVLGKVLSELKGDRRLLVYNSTPLEENLKAYVMTFVGAGSEELIYHGEHTYLYLFSAP